MTLLFLMGCRADPPRPDAGGEPPDAGGELPDAGVMEKNATLVSPKPARVEKFGASVAVRGETVLVGAPGSGAPERLSSGAAYLFERGLEGEWLAGCPLTGSETRANDSFGQAVAMAGEVIVIGAPFGKSGDISTGAVSVFERRGAGCDWVEQARLTPEGAGGGLFGAAVATDGTRVVVGAFDMGARKEGAVYVYSKQKESWTLEASLSASDRIAYAHFGISVALSGDTLLVGADTDGTQGDAAGAAYVFVYKDGRWSEQAKLLASQGDEFDFFGYSVELQQDTAVIGAHLDEDSGGTHSSGAVYVFSRSGEDWREQARLVPADNHPGGAFGISVALAGDTLVAGAYQNGDKGRNAGAVYVFQQADEGWREVSKLYREGASAEEEFGFWVDLSETGLLVGGAPGVDGPDTNAGAAYVTRRDISPRLGTAPGR
ncbi:MAG TPA: hypothetical protein VE057_13205 [Archangium sp.]|nr:hypothetical protein [Archangium sp.]